MSAKPRLSSDRLDAVLGALADSTRRQLLATLADRGPATATRLAEGAAITRQGVLKHLGVLEAAGLVASNRVGREVRFEADPAPVAEVSAWLSATATAWDQRLARLARRSAARVRPRG
jgi:DNA-binding transcriptional ArsR family regulator